jgi:tetratricopeptide (TPR) repeat protein
MAGPPNSGSKASLGDPEATGGLTALKGFDFQRAYALVLLVESLQDPDFAVVIIEGAEDVEARFDRESAVERRAVQVKSYRVTLALAKKIIARFVELDRASPGTWTSFVIACTGLDGTLQVIHNLLASYRTPQGFYDANADEILINTRSDLERRIIDAGLPAEFAIERVTFEPGLPDLAQLETWVRPRVLDVLQRAYPYISHAIAEDIYLRLRELGAESTQTSITRTQVKAEVEAVIPPAPVSATAPAPLDHFVGRQTELTDLAQALTRNDGFQATIALLGMGGAGKTALATQLVVQLASAFPGGVFWADLAAHAGDPLPILGTWARLCNQDVSGLTESQARAQAVRGFLASRVAERGRLLIILDDVRVDWLDGARALQSARPEGVPVLITAREAKSVYALGARSIQLDALSANEAIALLATLTSNILTGDKASHVAKLCGCLPLALTLAAAVATGEGADWLLDELSDASRRLDALELDDARRKEESVRLTFDVSYRSLAGRHPETARIFRYLGAFAATLITPVHLAGVLVEGEKDKRPGQVEVEAARAKAADRELRRLARWALVRREGLGRDMLSRYSLHPLLRQYAQDLLVEAGEAEGADQLHLAYYLAFAQTNAQAEPDAWDRLEEELPNLLLAATRAVEARDSTSVVSFEEALLHESKFLYVRGYFREVIDLFSQSLAVQEALGELQHQPRTLNKLAYFYAQLGQLEKAKKHAEAARRLARALEDKEQQADSLHYLGIILDGQGRKGLALDYFEREREIRRQIGNLSRLANCLNSLGLLQTDQGNYAEAIRYVNEAVAIYQQLGDDRGVAMCISDRGVPELYMGDYAKAMEDFETALDQSRELDYRGIMAQSLGNKGILQNYRGDYLSALESLDASLSLYQQLGDTARVAEALSAMAEAYAAMGDGQRAVESLRTAEGELRRTGDKDVEIEYLNALGTVHCEQGDYEGALADYVQMEALAGEARSMYFLAQCKLGLARTCLARGGEEDLADARRYAEEAIDLCQELRLAGSEPRGHAYLGQANLSLGEKEAALQNCREAIDLLSKQEFVHGSEAEIYLITLKVLKANGLEDERQRCLERAYDLVQATAANIEEEAWRQSYLQVPINREILETWAHERAGKTA